MADKQAVSDALHMLPEVASLEEITEELHIMASIRRGRADVAAGRSKSHEEVEQLVAHGRPHGLQGSFHSDGAMPLSKNPRQLAD